MPRMRRKADLPTKTCAACGRPFAWRRKWERDWENVRFCSDRCRSDVRRRTDAAEAVAPASATPRSRP
ncbi:DUF2256 domain-containing protein [Salinarimonas rosea]|uniref:DUF2256 domain-containing protein n=1 Tax=Salinarimonas rosea TaxID=552063 RepID=UPI000A062932|nr:DUF2256 domain-containing protein [Salinarimonas rosea]